MARYKGEDGSMDWAGARTAFSEAPAVVALDVASHTRDACQLLLLALYKLYQFDGRHLEALQVGKARIPLCRSAAHAHLPPSPRPLCCCGWWRCRT